MNFSTYNKMCRQLSKKMVYTNFESAYLAANEIAQGIMLNQKNVVQFLQRQNVRDVYGRLRDDLLRVKATTC